MPRLAVPRRRRAISLTSLIDVIFLLLLFFMLSSTFVRTGDLPLQAVARGGVGAGEALPAFLRVLPDRLVLGTVEVALADLPGALARDAGGVVLVAPADGVTAQRLVDVLVAAGGVPGVALQVIGGAGDAP